MQILVLRSQIWTDPQAWAREKKMEWYNSQQRQRQAVTWWPPQPPPVPSSLWQPLPEEQHQQWPRWQLWHYPAQRGEQQQHQQLQEWQQVLQRWRQQPRELQFRQIWQVFGSAEAVAAAASTPAGSSCGQTVDHQAERLQEQEWCARVMALCMQAQQQEAREARPDGGQHQAKGSKRRRKPPS